MNEKGRGACPGYVHDNSDNNEGKLIEIFKLLQKDFFNLLLKDYFKLKGIFMKAIICKS